MNYSKNRNKETLLVTVLTLFLRKKKNLNNSFTEDNTMTATLFTIIIIGVIFWLAFQNGVLAFFAALCILGLIALIVDEARQERKEEQWLKEQEQTV